jgi:hypothetical protein
MAKPAAGCPAIATATARLASVTGVGSYRASSTRTIGRSGASPFPPGPNGSVSPSRTRTVVDAATGYNGAQSISTPASAIACSAPVQSSSSLRASGVPGSGLGASA